MGRPLFSSKHETCIIMQVSLLKIFVLSIQYSSIFRAFNYFTRKLRASHFVNITEPYSLKTKDRVIIVGSGQSLQKISTRKDLKTHTVVCLNGSFIRLLEMGIRPNYVLIEDFRAFQIFASQAVKEGIDLILASDLPTTFDGARVSFQRNYGFPFFIKAPKWGDCKKSYYGGTVAYFALQIFSSENIKRIDLYGLDMSYKVLDNSVRIGKIEIILSNNSYLSETYNSRIIRKYEDPALINEMMVNSIQSALDRMQYIEVRNYTDFAWII